MFEGGNLEYHPTSSRFNIIFVEVFTTYLSHNERREYEEYCDKSETLKGAEQRTTQVAHQQKCSLYWSSHVLAFKECFKN